VSPEVWRELLQGMIDDIGRIRAFIGPMTRDEFIADERTVFAVCYAFVRLGEAVSRLPEEVRVRHPGVEWREVRQFRNFMIHVYHGVDPARLYDTAATYIEPLAEKLRRVLRTI
jgi:uncharacterized protein with HEPN domain